IYFGLNAQWFYQEQDIIEKPAAGIVPGVTGLQIGVVIKIEGDPDKEDRVKVRIPAIDQNEGIWSRMASPDAGKERGAFFRPEIHDEVVVGFLNGDPRHAIILGMLNSSAHPAPLPSKDDNHQKGFITRSKIKFVFDDDKKSLRMETPNGKVIEINDDKNEITLSDKNNNKIRLGSDGISIESAKDISFKTSAGNVKIEGKSVEVKAATKSSISGTASAELVSTGQTKIQGGIVNIN
ncbi:MAG TPA: type VI secretion system tip protein VgrG, partial [Bacteroidales bacterium]|nr:type VI secretion system tip protein VgrG [Bacteroidales bacterium]